MSHKIDLIYNSFDPALMFTFVGGMVSSMAWGTSAWWVPVAVYAISALWWILIFTHDGNAMDYNQRVLWSRYQALPPDLQARVALTREWIREELPKLEHNEREEIYDAVAQLYKTHHDKVTEEAKQLVAYRHIVDEVKAATADEKQEYRNLKQINDEIREML